MMKVPQHGIVFQQVRQRLRVGYVINCDEVYVLVAERRAKNVSANPAEPVDANPHRHALSPSRFPLSLIRSSDLPLAFACSAWINPCTTRALCYFQPQASL